MTAFKLGPIRARESHILDGLVGLSLDKGSDVVKDGALCDVEGVVVLGAVDVAEGTARRGWLHLREDTIKAAENNRKKPEKV